jgi:hypothetical protein
MAERDSLWVNGALDPEEVRVGEGAVWTPATNAVRARTGIRPASGNPGAVTATGTPDSNVHISPFQAVVQSTRATAAGAYIATLDAVKDINVLSTPAHASLARNDLIVAHQSDVFYGDADSLFRVRQIVGTPSGSPADPSLTGYPDAIPLARVRVNAAATSITAANITDLRPTTGWTVAVGGTLPVANQAARDALTGIYDGLTIYRQDRDWSETYNGSVWRVNGIALVSSTGDLTAVTSPYTGQLAVNSADGLTYRYTGAAWQADGLWRSSQLLAAPAASVTITIPNTVKNVTIRWTARSSVSALVDVVYVRINNDSTTLNYLHQITQLINATLTATANPISTDKFFAGNLPGNTTLANNYGSGVFEIQGWDAPHQSLSATWRSVVYGDAAPTAYLVTGGGWFRGASPYTTVQVFPTPGNNFMAGTRIDAYGYE